MTHDPKGTPVAEARPPILAAHGITKYFGTVIALRDVDIEVHPGEVVCLLGDNGAGKSTLIKILSGVHPPDAGELTMDGGPVVLRSSRDALDRGIATVYQDLAVMPLMSVSRNFFLGSEPRVGRWPFRRYDRRTADRITREELSRIGIDLRSTQQLAGTLSGGERQSIAIARAIHFGARVVILDARARGLGVILITHNPTHAFPVGDRFTVLDRGHCVGTFAQGELEPEELLTMMGGGADLTAMTHELQALRAAVRMTTSSPAPSHDAEGGSASA